MVIMNRVAPSGRVPGPARGNDPGTAGDGGGGAGHRDLVSEFEQGFEFTWGYLLSPFSKALTWGVYLNLFQRIICSLLSCGDSLCRIIELPETYFFNDGIDG